MSELWNSINCLSIFFVRLKKMWTALTQLFVVNSYEHSLPQPLTICTHCVPVYEKPSHWISTSVHFISFCGDIANVSAGKLVHSQLLASGIVVNPILTSALITMYTECGCIDEAEKVFLRFKSKYWKETWNAMMAKLDKSQNHLNCFIPSIQCTRY